MSWGHLDIEGLGVGKDFKLYPGGGRAWDWSETGTRHVPGIQPADVEELLAHGATAVVFSRGMDQQHPILEARLAVQRAEDFSVTADVAAQVSKVGLRAGGTFHRHQSTVWSITATFPPNQSRALRAIKHPFG